MLTPATWAQLLPCNLEKMLSAVRPHAVRTMSAITIPLGLPEVLPCMYKGYFCSSTRHLAHGQVKAEGLLLRTCDQVLFVDLPGPESTQCAHI